MKNQAPSTKIFLIALSLIALTSSSAFGASILMIENRTVVSVLTEFTLDDGSIASFETRRVGSNFNSLGVYDYHGYRGFDANGGVENFEAYNSSKVILGHHSGNLYADGEVDTEQWGDGSSGPITFFGTVVDTNVTAFASLYWDFLVIGDGLELERASLLAYERPSEIGQYFRLTSADRGILFELEQSDSTGWLDLAGTPSLLSPGRYTLEAYISEFNGDDDSENAFVFNFGGVDNISYLDAGNISRVPDGGSCLHLAGFSVLSILGLSRLMNQNRRKGGGSGITNALPARRV